MAKQPPVSPFQRIWRQITQRWRMFFGEGDLSTLVMSLVLVMLPAFALRDAGWAVSMPILLPVIILSVLLGFLLARSYYNELLALFIMGVYGACFILIVAAINEPGSITEGAISVFTRVFRWIVDATSGGINQDDLVFTLLIAGLFWFLGYNVVWHIFRIDRVWRALLPPALILITNNVYYMGDANLDIYLALFMFLSLLLIVRSNLDAREWHWYTSGIRVPRRLRAQFSRMGFVLALVVMLFGWGIPSGDLQERLNRFQEFMQAEPLQQLSEFWNRLFSSIETQGPTTADYYGGDSLNLGGAIRLGDQTVFLVSAPPGRRYYWRSRTFDIYDNGRWTSAADTRLTDPEVPLDIVFNPMVDGSRVSVQQQFTMGLNASRILYAAPQPARIDLPTRTDLRYLADGSMNISVIRPMQILYRGDQYTVNSLMSEATADQLRTASTQYPQEIADIYLPFSPSVTQRTIDLAHQIVNEAGAVTPYDKARAIELYLRGAITYNETIPQPPLDVDPVDWFLFDIKEGYCNYYASSMIVMLRSLGIPARMAAGFAQGDWDAGENAYHVRERDAHTWVEVYFPEYGWIEFEPTSAQAPIERGDEMPPPPAIPLIDPTPTEPPLPTPTFTPTPTAGVPDVPPMPESNELPSPTPTFTPSPTPTPVIVPTTTPPLPPQRQDIFSFILPAILSVFAVIFGFLLLIGLGFLIYWWWEWRGMRGLSPIVRAYARLERYLGLLGIRLSPLQTPAERRDQIAESFPPVEPPATAITRLYEQERYAENGGRKAATDSESQTQAADRAWLDARRKVLDGWLRRFMFWRRD